MSLINRKRLFPVLILLISLIFAVVIGQLLMLVKQGLDVYENIKIPSNMDITPLDNIGRITSPLVEVDSELGAAPIPGATGNFIIPRGEAVPFHNNKKGFRSQTGRDGDAPHLRPRLLFLGDSFTYGLLVKASDTFPEKAAMYTQGEAINAGVPGYSLAQMLLYARRLTPEYKPDFIIVQYSPWLVSRSKTGLVTDSKLSMAPYFIHENGKMEVMPPPFTAPHSIMRRSEKYKKTPSGLTDALLFFTTVGIPYYLHHTYHSLIFHTRQFAGLTPQKTTNSIEIIRYTYQELDQLAKQNDSRLIIVTLGTLTSLHVPYDLFPKDAIIIDAWKNQVEALKDRSSWGYLEKYFLWRGNPAVPVDWHPNEAAHEIIAKSIYKKLNSETMNSFHGEDNQKKSTNEIKTHPLFQECLQSERLLRILPPSLSINKIINETTLPEFRKNNEARECKN